MWVDDKWATNYAHIICIHTYTHTYIIYNCVRNKICIALMMPITRSIKHVCI